MFRSTGRLRYSPTINGSTNRRDGGTTKWWLVVDCDPEIGRYYRTLYSMWTYKTSTLQQPAWSAHISIVRNERPPNEKAWKKYAGKPIEYTYIPKLEFNGIYVWLPVICDQALDIREELGLSREPYYSLHLTIGNRKEERGAL